MIAWILWPQNCYTITEETPTNVSLRVLGLNVCAGFCHVNLANAENYISQSSFPSVVRS